jgi:hypothetical protein
MAWAFATAGDGPSGEEAALTAASSAEEVSGVVSVTPLTGVAISERSTSTGSPKVKSPSLSV